MNEADTPNNGNFLKPLNSANVAQPQQASCPFDFVGHPTNKTISYLPLLAPAEARQSQAEVIDETDCDRTPTAEELLSHTSSLSVANTQVASDRVLEFTQPPLQQPEPEQDWVAEPDQQEQELVGAEFQQLLALNEELRSANNELYEQVEHLKAALTESEEALQLQSKRSTIAETMLKQQAQELAAAQEQIKSLFEQLETAVSTVQTQEIFIESSKGQLEISQNRLAQLERECALLQTKYNEQSHQLLQSENSNRELRSRLMRQQRQTLQFKAALEKCLDTTVPSYDSLEDNPQSSVGNRNTTHSKQANSIFSNQRPIRPWTAESESLEDEPNNVWKEFNLPLHRWEHSTPPIQSPIINTSIQEAQSTANQPNIQPEIDSSTPSTPVSPSEQSNLEEQLNNLFQTFFTAQPASPQPTQEKDVADDDDIDVEDGEEVMVQSSESFATALDDSEELVNNIITNPETNSDDNQDDLVETLQLSPQQLPATSVPTQPVTDDSAHSNSPSPLLYPQRPPKKRTSLASVELPNFRPSPNSQ
ncbi:hypothetical protein ACF3DV_06335 [Chlorogloeopsis fritschii PCC 9212]|uniref:Uncharacterized protein n=1 Tax=Chlorogloeopsis fritschii PCC 6912 TaxID=211165 RepID=A0A3S0ZB50_CHLFR|nr:hypothetical protein [Chlorogloeopsis fritschii]RUR72668.1 hypothetical protein PCC6912_61340 [Chlorogloeopsis fritschii PCC 6912]